MKRRTPVILALVVCSCFTPATAWTRGAGLKKPSFDSKGVPIHYIVTGRQDGEAVVLIHGFADKMEPQWTKVIAALKPDFKVVALDCRGHGGSGKPHDSNKYGIEMVNDVARLLDHLKIDKAHIAGYSMGAVIALNFAVHHPRRVRTVTVAGSSGSARSHKKLMLELADSLEKGNGLGPFLVALTPKGKPLPTPEVIKRIDAAVLAINDARVLAAVSRGAAGDKGLLLSDKQIEGVRAPTLALIGADDPFRNGVDQLKKLLPKTRVVVIDKTDHGTAWTRPEFVGALRKFLDENRKQSVK